MKRYLYILGGWLIVLFAGQTAYAQETCYEYYENTDVTNGSIFTEPGEGLVASAADNAGSLALVTRSYDSSTDVYKLHFYYYDQATETYKTKYFLGGHKPVIDVAPYITRNGKYVLLVATPGYNFDNQTFLLLYDVEKNTFERTDLSHQHHNHCYTDNEYREGEECETIHFTYQRTSNHNSRFKSFKLSEDGKYVSYYSSTASPFDIDESGWNPGRYERESKLHLLNLETGSSEVIDQISYSQDVQPYSNRNYSRNHSVLMNSRETMVSNDGQYLYYLRPTMNQNLYEELSQYNLQFCRYNINTGAKTILIDYTSDADNIEVRNNAAFLGSSMLASRNDQYIVFRTYSELDSDESGYTYRRYNAITGEVDDFTSPHRILDVSNEGKGLLNPPSLVGTRDLYIYDIETDNTTLASAGTYFKIHYYFLSDSVILAYGNTLEMNEKEDYRQLFHKVSLNCEQSTGNSAYPYYAFYQDELYNTFNEADATAGKYTDYSGQQTTLTATGNITPAPNRFGKDSAAVHIEGLGSRLSLDGGTLNPGSGNANTSLANVSLANTTNARVTTNETDPTLVGQPVTIAVWFKMDNFNYGESANRILDKTGGTLLRNNEGNEYYLNIAYDADNPTPRLHFACMDALGGVRELTSSQEVVAGEWQLALIEKNENNTIKIYHNGAPIGILTGARIRGNLAPLDIGGHASEFESWQFEGDIDDLFIQPRILTDCEKDALWSARPAQLSGTPPTYEANPQKRIAQYSFAEGSLEDAMGNYPATNQGAVPTEDKFTQKEQAMRFEGNSSLTTSIDFDGTRNNYSASVWFKAESTLTGNLLKIEGDGYEWRLSLEDNQLVFYQNGSCKQSGRGSTRTPESELLQAGRWYHLIASFDFESQVKTIYLSDGEEEVNLGLETTVVTELSDLYIDRMPKGTLTIGEAFTGTLDNVQLFGKVLDYCEMRQIFIQERFAFQHPADQNRGTEGLVAHYPMIDDLELISHALDNVPYTQYTAQADISGNTQHLSILNEDLTRGATEALPGHGLQPGQAIRYLFSDIRFAVPSEVASLKQDSAAISLWFKPTELGFTQTLLDKTEGVDNEGSEYRIQLQPDGHLRLAYFTEYVEEACGGYEETVSDVSVNINEWYHLVVIKSNNNLRWYLNNAPAGEDVSIYLSRENSRPAVLGASPGEGAALTLGFTGVLDDLRFYHRGLSRAEVEMLYELGTLELTLSNYYFAEVDVSGSLDQWTSLVNGSVEQPGAMGHVVWYWDAFLPLRPSAYFPQLAIRDTSKVTWVRRPRSGVKDTLAHMSGGYHFNDREGADEWGHLVIKPVYTYQTGAGHQHLALEITDRIKPNATLGGSTNMPLEPGEIALEVLDYGVYFFGDGPKQSKKFNLIKDLSGTTYFDPNKPTIIYTHSHQYGMTKGHQRDLWDTPQLLEIAQKWRAKGYNFGIFYWNQFADAFFIEGRIRRDRTETESYMDFMRKRLRDNWKEYREDIPLDANWLTSLKKSFATQIKKLPGKMLDLIPAFTGANLPTWKLEGQPFETNTSFHYKVTGQTVDETHLGEITDIADLLQMYLKAIRAQSGTDVELRVAGAGFGAQLAVEASARMVVDGDAPDRVAMLDLMTLPDLFEDLLHGQSGKARTGEAAKTLVANGTLVEAYTGMTNGNEAFTTLVDLLVGSYSVTKGAFKAPGKIAKAITSAWDKLSDVRKIKDIEALKTLLKALNQLDLSVGDIEGSLAPLDMGGFFEQNLHDVITRVIISEENHWTGQEWNYAVSEFPAKYYYLYSIDQEEEASAPYVRALSEADVLNVIKEADPGAALEDLIDQEIYDYDVLIGYNPVAWDPTLEEYLQGEEVIIDQLFYGAFEEVNHYTSELLLRKAPSAALSTETMQFWDETALGVQQESPYQGQILIQLEGDKTAEYADDIFVNAYEYAQSDWGDLAPILVIEGSELDQQVIEECEKRFGSGSVIKGNVVIRAVPEFCLIQEACQIYTLDEEIYVLLDCRDPNAGIRAATETAEETKAYPNPFSNHIEVVMEARQAKIITVRLYDLLGRPMYTLEENGTVYEGTHKVRWDTGQVASGLYLLVIETDTGERLTTKVVKQ